MTRDFGKNLTIMVAGSGNATFQHLEESLADWIFGPVDEREVHVILPVLTRMGGAIRNLIKLGTEWEFKFTVIQAKGAAMTRELSALPEECFIRVASEREALEHGLDLLAGCYNGEDETAFLLAYNPKSVYEQGDPALSDLEILGDAKNHRWLSTMNLCEGLIDSFEGYRTTDEIIREQNLKKEFEDKQREEEAANPKPAKKAPASRKQVQKKPKPQESKPLVIEPEKPLEEPSVGTTVEVGGIEFTKHSPNPFRSPLPGNPIHDDPRNELSADVKIDLTPSPDIWEDIQKHHWATFDGGMGWTEGSCTICGCDYQTSEKPCVPKRERTHTITVSKIDLAQLSSLISELTTAFGNIMDTFTRILKDG